MYSRPLIIIKLVVKNFRIQKIHNWNSLFDEIYHQVFQYETGYKVVLVILHKINDDFYSSVLIVLKSILYRWSVVVFLVLFISFPNSRFIEKWLFISSSFFEIVVKIFI